MNPLLLLGAGAVLYALWGGNAEWKWFQPVPGGKITSGFGKRLHPISKVWKLHNGIDIDGEVGTPIYCAGDGVVIEASFDKQNGNFIIIRHDNDYLTGYAHLSSRKASLGQRVQGGKLLALMGNTGNSTGPHLHFTLTAPDGTKINPEPVFYPA
jgi:murein DD-endopeptidase MepM/ murein hydrolase activator NlpD